MTVTTVDPHRRHLAFRRWVVTAAVAMCALVAAALVLLQGVSAQTASAPASKSAAATAAPLRILAIGEPTWGGIQELKTYLAGPALAAAGLPPVTMDLIGYPNADQLVADLKAVSPNIHRYAAIYSTSVTAARYAQQLVSDVPIIFEGVDNALDRCLVDSLQQPGRNATGYMHVLDDSEARMVQVLHDAFPELRQIIVLASGSNLRMRHCNDTPRPRMLPGCKAGLHDDDALIDQIMPTGRLVEQARQQRIKLKFLLLCGPQDIARLGEFVGKDSGVVVPWQMDLDRQDPELVAVFDRLARPAIAARTLFAKNGGLMALSVQLPPVQPRESLRMLTQVLQGQSPRTMPVTSPYGLKLTINARVAKAQGLRPSMEVWQRADEVLE